MALLHQMELRLEITRKNYRIIIRHYRNRDTRIVQCLYIIIVLGPAGMDEKMVAEMNEAMKAVAEDPTVKDGIASIGCIPGWHDFGRV